MAGNVAPYLALITSEHNQQPTYNSVLTALLQPFADQIGVAQQVINSYNLDTAVGVQLDTVGQWIGVTRYVKIPVTGIFFSFDTANLGFDQGSWSGAFDNGYSLYALDDTSYRLLLYSTVAANHWDGDIPDALALLNAFWNFYGYTMYIIDGQDMTMSFLLVGPALTPVLLSLYSQGVFDIRPAGVTVINHYFVVGSGGVPTAPIFGFDLQTPVIAGFDTGVWAGNTAPLTTAYNPPGMPLILNFKGAYTPPGMPLILNFTLTPH